MEEHGKTQESARTAQEAARRFTERARDTAAEVTRNAGQAASLMNESNSTWTDAGRTVLDEMLKLSGNTLRESARVMSHLQEISIDSVRAAQDGLWRWQRLWPFGFVDPARSWQAAVEEAVNAAQQTMSLTQRTAEVVGDSYRRLQGTAEQSGRVLSETLRTASSRMQDLYAKAERQRAA
jgi:hypothetical protein